MLNTEQTFVALRVSAFASSVTFAAHYALRTRKLWFGFVAFHLIHLGFILWLGCGLHHRFSAFALTSGSFSYGVLLVLATGEIRSPGTIEQHGFWIAFLGLNLLGTYVLQIVHALANGHGAERIHSFVAAALLLMSVFIRWHGAGRRRASASIGSTS